MRIDSVRSNGILWLLAVILVGGGSGCGYDQAYVQANEMAALQHLRQFRSAAEANMAEFGTFGTLDEIYVSSGMISPKIYDATDSVVNPDPVAGYLFSELWTAPGGHALDRNRRFGMVAYPVRPGESGRAVMMLLVDVDWAESSEDQDPSIVELQSAYDNSWGVFVASDPVEGPVTEWPNENELGSLWLEVPKQSPMPVAGTPGSLGLPSSVPSSSTLGAARNLAKGQ